MSCSVGFAAPFLLATCWHGRLRPAMATASVVGDEVNFTPVSSNGAQIQLDKAGQITVVFK